MSALVTEALAADTRVMILGRNAYWRGPNMWGWEATVQSYSPQDGYCLRLPWLVTDIYLAPEFVSPVYNDCEVCGYAAWRAENFGTEKKPDYHHFCAWHIPERLEIEG